MFDWISHLFKSDDDATAPRTVNPELLFQLREELNECEAIYRAAAYLCQHTCRDEIEGDPDQFPELMVDLHRGLLIKIFVEISNCDRRWHAEERELAKELLHHVWGVQIDHAKLLKALQNVSELDDSLTWESVLGPFVRIPALRNQHAKLVTCMMRIANLIAKADGKILPAEIERLKSLQSEVKRVLRPDKRTPDTSRTSESQAGKQVAQLLPRRPGKADARSRKSKSTAPANKPGPVETKPPAEMLASAMDELKNLIGLDSLKTDIQQLVNFLKVQEQRQTHELPKAQISLHTVFVGNPGTGKTTVARILARIFCGLRILVKGHTVETDRTGLVAEYMGQTGPKVQQRMDEALDGLLFVDEAYSLIAERGEDPFGHEAVQVLLKRMEDDRERLVVVLAGYPEPMKRLLCSNPGLSSRFQRTFEFPDYSPKELLQIFESMCANAQYVLTTGARERLGSVFQAAFDQRDEFFGNARLARNLFERAIGRLANRIVEIAPVTRALLTQLESDDIQADDVVLPHKIETKPTRASSRSDRD